MSSRRLDISSLLCPDSVSPSFQALVHAASEERRRLSQQDHDQGVAGLVVDHDLVANDHDHDLVANDHDHDLVANDHDHPPLVPHYRPHHWLYPHNLSPPISPVFSNIHNLTLPSHPTRAPHPDAALKHEPDMDLLPPDDVANDLLSLLDDKPPPPKLPPAPFKPPESMPLSPAPCSPSATSPPIPPLPSHRASMPPPPPTLATTLSHKDPDKHQPPHANDKAVAKKTKLPSITQQKSKSTNKSKALEGTKHSRASSAKRKSAVANHFAASRSRSTSLMASGSVEPESEPKYDEKEDEPTDNKLYCVCKTKYDEDRFMIACDRCDEWYHTTCVNMPESEVELVDQFFCPPCIQQNIHLNLKTTYKQRCLNGLRHPNPDSSKACHKPARGAISKYCSDECGVEYMQSRIDAWAKKGGQKEQLWESVKKAEKREGITVCVDEKMRSDWEDKVKKQSRTDRETERLGGLLDQVVKMRKETRDSMEIIAWREQLLQLASERAEHIDQCGWDQRLCFGEKEWQAYGAGVLESYGMKDENEEDEAWWCSGQRSCKRHNGWQTLRYKDICKEREKQEELLNNLTIRERQLRKRIEDLMIDSSACKPAPLKSSNTKSPNGYSKSKGSNETLKKGKKRKVPAS